MSEDRLDWVMTEVAGRRAEYGVGGAEGPVVLFLHGWGLGSHAYKRSIKRLLSRGCRVYAPSLPSFGRTQDLPWRQMNLDGYGAWVAQFCDAVGIDQPALVIGHSFGGGVGIKLAELRPDLVSYLVLLNAVGGVGARPPWEWAFGFIRELWPPSQAFDATRAISSDLIPNLVRNPFGMALAARLAQTADLRREAAALGRSGTPVLVLTSEGDTVIPREAFDALCSAIGSEGRVVSGRHSWILADPDSFASALSALVDVQVAAHHENTAASHAEEIQEILSHTKIPPRRIKALVDQAPPLWLMSDSSGALAADLAMFFPKLGPNEVRAVARRIDSSSAMRLTVVANDRRGLLADSAGVLAANGLSITHASAATWKAGGLALHSFVVHGGARLDQDAWDRVGHDLRSRNMARPDGKDSPTARVRPASVTIHGHGGNQMMVTVRTPDRVGVLAGICATLSNLGANIESLQARSRDGQAVDTFLVSGSPDPERIQREFGN
jgi:pimeloyl-ACP methyl ester carboxylesterase/predicted amino acid-binding ACT domain protein